MLSSIYFVLRNHWSICLSLMVGGLLSSCITGAHDAPIKLYQAELVSIKQLSNSYPFSYEQNASINLSGMAISDGEFYLVGDKSHDPYLYKVKHDEFKWSVTNRFSIALDQPASFEGMFSFDSQFLLVNEDPAGVYLLSSGVNGYESQPISIEYGGRLKSGDIAAAGKSNKGFEGVAVDPVNNLLFLALEREPAILLKVQLNEGRTSGTLIDVLSDWGDLGLQVPFSLADLYFDGGYIYSLERANYMIAKIDPVQMRVVARLDFSFVKDRGLSLYQGEDKYGTAEALVLAGDRIYVGTDNNGSYVDQSNRWVEEFNLEGNQPSIIKLLRPKGF